MVLDPEEYNPPYVWPSLSTDSSDFMWREKILGHLNDLLEKHIAVVVVGMKGIGKTELALQYFNKYKINYQGGSYWFDLRDRDLADVLADELANHPDITEELLKEEIRSKKNLTLAQKKALELSSIDPSELIQLYWNQLLLLSNKKTKNIPDDRCRVLVVLDSVKTGYGITEDMFPSESRFRLLLMAEEPDLVFHSKINNEKLNLEKLEPKHAVELLKKWAGRQIEDKAAEYLCDELLDRSPLGIELAGHYLRKNQKMTIFQYNEKLENEYIQSGAPIERRWIYSVLELSWQKLEDRQSQTLAKLLGLFAPREIPFEFPTMIVNYAELEIRVNRENSQEETNENLGYKEAFKKYTRKQAQKISESLSPTEKKRLNPEEVFQTLADLRLIKWNQKNNTAILDTIIRDFLKTKVKNAENVETLKQTFVKILLKKGPNLKWVNPKRFILIAPHLDEVIINYTAQLKDEEFELFIDVGNYYDGRRMYLAGAKWYKKWLEKANDRLGGKYCSKEKKWENLATLYDKIDNYQKENPRYRRACQICEKLSKADPNALIAADPNVLIEIVKILKPKLKLTRPSLCHLYKRIGELSFIKYGAAHQLTKEAETKYQCECPNSLSKPAGTISSIG